MDSKPQREIPQNPDSTGNINQDIEGDEFTLIWDLKTGLIADLDNSPPKEPEPQDWAKTSAAMVNSSKFGIVYNAADPAEDNIGKKAAVIFSPYPGAKFFFGRGKIMNLLYKKNGNFSFDYLPDPNCSVFDVRLKESERQISFCQKLSKFSSDGQTLVDFELKRGTCFISFYKE